MKGGSATLDYVAKGQLCTGCGLCAGVSSGAVSMEIDAGGYARPMVRDAVASDAATKIASACVGVAVAPWQPAPATHAYWGPSHAVLTGHATDQALRQGASSGGAISALAIHALESGVVDAVVQTTTHPNDPRKTASLISETAADIAACMGSRYGPSSPLAEIGRMLDDNRRFAFVGKPCDVSALRLLGRSDPRVAQRFPVMLSFFCAGIPSLAGTDAILADLGVAKDDLATFRYRGDGWPGKARATRRDGTFSEMSYEESWGKRLSPVVQFRCKICPDAVGGVADIACADAWYGGETGYPQFEEADGRSLILPRSETGVALLASAVAAGKVATEPLAIAEIDLMQPSQARRKRLIASRLAALALTFQARPRFVGVSVGLAARTAGAGETVKSFLGLVRRVIRGRK